MGCRAPTARIEGGPARRGLSVSCGSSERVSLGHSGATIADSHNGAHQERSPEPVASSTTDSVPFWRRADKERRAGQRIGRHVWSELRNGGGIVSEVVLAISGSLRKPSFTERMLDLCIEGMGDGLEVHKFYPHKMAIGPCTSCFSCWGKKRPGECVQKDDFEKILDVYMRADYLLLAAPLYIFDLPATVKNVIDRFFIILEPSQVQSSTGQTEHPKRFGRHPKAVLISSCGFLQDHLRAYGLVLGGRDTHLRGRRRQRAEALRHKV